MNAKLEESVYLKEGFATCGVAFMFFKCIKNDLMYFVASLTLNEVLHLMSCLPL